MKRIKYIFPIIALFIMTACNSDDDGFYNTVYVDAVNLVTIEAQPTYNVGDNLFVSATIPNLLPEPGETTPLNLLETTNSTTFVFSYVLEKMNGAGEWELVDASGNFILDRGDVRIGSFLQAVVEYDGTAEYKFRGGITLVNAGQYRLSFGYNSSEVNKIQFISESTNNNISLNINSTATGLDTSGYYNFIVN